MPTRPSPDPARTAVVVVAAGSGTRLGHGIPKALVRLAGRTLLEHALDAVAATDAAECVVVVPAGDTELTELALRHPRGPGPRVVTGGATRHESVAAGLAAVGGRCGTVLIHDAARCLTPPAVFDAVAAAVRAGADAVVPAVPVVDTIKTAVPAPDPAIAPEAVAGTPPRAGLRAVQTPQGFRTEALRAAHARAADLGGEAITDDAMLMEAAGATVHLVPGSPLALKITTPTDLLLAGAILAAGAGAGDEAKEHP